MQNDINSLLEKHRAGRLDAQEQEILERLVHEYNLYGPVSTSDQELFGIREEMWAAIKPVKSDRPKTHRLWYSMAAAILVIVSIGTYLYLLAPTPSGQQPSNIDIAPGIQSATLTLANGKKIRLQEMKNGNLAQQQGVLIKKTATGELVYTIVDAQAKENSSTSASNAYNTLSTAYGETYCVQLPDGSKVWLNAGSSLKYPVSFASASERRVELTGEGYFEVAKINVRTGKTANYQSKGPTGRVPFIVKSAGLEVEVLGTHFNVNAYTDEPSARATLLEGTVRVSQTRNLSARILKPGQQAISHPAAPLEVAQVDAEGSILWKEGKFAFEREDLESVMRKVARWYNVKVQFEDSLQQEKITGTVSRFANISTLLRKIEQTGGVHFTISGNGREKKIVVSR